ncbi:MAG: DUF1540 domain-containing protein [Coriobacteriia bacterium]
MKFLEQEGAIMTCNATQCSYNQVEECHAESIHVGGDHAICDTFTTTGAQELATSTEGEVGGCDMIECHFNEDRDCEANGVTVATHNGHADCFTFRPQV